MQQNAIERKEKRKQPKRKRACLVYYSIFNGSALLYREAKAVAEQGYETDIICLREKKVEARFREFEGLRLYCIQSRAIKEKSTLLYMARLAVFFVKAFFLLVYLGTKRRYSLVQVTSPPDVLVFAALVPKLLGAKIILDIHDISPELFMRKMSVPEDFWIIRLLKLAEKLSAGFSDHVITVNHLWLERLKSRSVSSDKCSVMLNVPDDRLFKPRPLQAADRNGLFRIIYHGTFEEHFGVDTLIEALPRISSGIPRLSVHLFGRGGMLDYYRSRSRSLGVESFITFHGVVPFYELPDILRDIDLGVVPTKDSVFSDEAISMKSFEYISMGIPIVISGTKAHRYYYNEKMVTFFVPGDAGDLARSVLLVYENREMRERAVAEGLDLMKSIGWEKTRTSYLQLIDKLVCS